MKKSFLFISCDEAKHICDKMQYDEASTWERLKLKFRLCYCRMSKNYFSKNTKLTEAIAKSNVNCLNIDERTKIQKQFEEGLLKSQQN